MITLKDVFLQVHQLPREMESFESYWERWDGSPELLEVIQAYLIKYHSIPKNVVVNSTIKCNGDFHLGDK